MESGSHKVRPATLKDLADFTRLVDCLPCVDICLKSVIPQDVSQTTADIRAAAVLIANTDKHIHLSQDCPSNVPFITRTILNLFAAAARDHATEETPFFS